MMENNTTPANSERYTPKTFYRVIIVHVIFCVVAYVLSSLGIHYTEDRVILTRTKNETEAGKHAQSDVPYWVFGLVLGSLHLIMVYFSCYVYRLINKGVYTAIRKEAAISRFNMYTFLLVAVATYGIAGAAMVGVHGTQCDYESDETCYYAYTNYKANKGLAITLVVVHVLWILVALDMLIKRLAGFDNQVGSIPVGIDLENPPKEPLPTITAPHRPADNGPIDAWSPRSNTPAAPTRPSSNTRVASPPPLYNVAVSGASEPPPYGTVRHTQPPSGLYAGTAFPDDIPTLELPQKKRLM